MVFSTTPVLTDDEQTAVVDRAIALMAGGLSQTKATTRAGAEFGCSAATVRNYARLQDRPLAQVTDEQSRRRAAKARHTLHTYSIGKQRDLAHRLIAIVERRIASHDAEARKKAPPPDLDLRIQRTIAALAAVVELEHALAMRGGVEKQAHTPPENVHDLEETRRLLREIERRE